MRGVGLFAAKRKQDAGDRKSEQLPKHPHSLYSSLMLAVSCETDKKLKFKETVNAIYYPERKLH